MLYSFWGTGQFLKVFEHLACILIRILLQGYCESPVGFLPVFLRQMSLNVFIFMDSASLVEELFPIAVLYGLDDAPLCANIYETLSPQ